MSTHFDLTTYIYSNLLNSKNAPWQFAAAIANCCGSLDPISRAGCYFNFDSYVTCLILTVTLHMYTSIHINFFCIYSPKQ